MGYETTLLFIRNYGKKPIGYCPISASLELSKIYWAIGDLVEKARSRINPKERDKLSRMIDNLEEMRKTIYDGEGDYTEEARKWTEKQRDSYGDRICSLRKRIEKKLPAIFWQGDDTSYRDNYGDLLLVVTLDELRCALLEAQKKAIKEDDRLETDFVLALQMINHFQTIDSGNHWVVLWGH